MTSITSSNTTPFTVGVALNGAGWHPAAWREPNARPDELFTPEYWRSLVASLADGGADYSSIDDSLAIQAASPFGGGEIPARPTAETVQGRLDALLLLSWIAPLVERIGVIPTVTTTHTEPFHVATALQTLDHISTGRTGWQVKISTGAAEAAAFGRKPAPRIDIDSVLAGRADAGLDELLDEAADAVEVARRLWDSWEDDAVIRDTATGRFLDRDRLHHIGFEGERFSIVGPSIVPRSPQGQLPVTLLAHSAPVHRLAARSADVVFVIPDSDHVAAGASRGRSAAEIIAEVRVAEAATDRAALGLQPLRIVGDLVVALDGAAGDESGRDRIARLERVAGQPFSSDAAIAAGSAGEIADRIAAWRDAGIEGVRIRPLAQPDDVRAIVDLLLPELRERGLASPLDARPESLRERFGLGVATNRYTSRGAGTGAATTTAVKAPELLEAAR